MKKVAVLLILQLCSFAVTGQELAKQQKVQYVVIPREQVLIVVVSQPDSPLRIEDATCIFRTDTHKTSIRYRVRNQSSKPITFFTVVSWDIYGSGGTLPDVMKPGDAIGPGTLLDSLNASKAEIIPLTPELRERLKRDAKRLFEGEMREVYFLVVDQVLFTDGSAYKDQVSSQALADFLSRQNCGSENVKGAKHK